MGTLASGTITTQNLNATTGVPTTGSTISLGTDADVAGYDYSEMDTLTIQVTGTYTGVLTPQATTNGTTWVSLGTSSIFNVGTSTYSSTIASGTVGIYIVNVAGFRGFRLSALAAVTGTASVTFAATSSTGAVALNGALPTGTNTVGTVNLGTAGTSATSIGKAEDAVSASGDTLVAVAGVRVSTTPAAQTSAAGDYGTIAIDSEGKLVASQYASTDHYWQSSALTLSTTTSTALKAAAAAGVRNYLTDIDIANTSATGVRVDLLDNATVMASFWVPPTSHVQHSYSIPKKGTAATAMNVQLSAAVTDVRVSANGYIGT